MSTSRKRRPDLSDRACLACQRRKTKCIPSGDGQPCEYCTKTGKRCQFAEPPNRTPLTRKNLDDLESRCHHLEAIIESLQRSNGPPVSHTENLRHEATAAPKHAVGSTYEWNEDQDPKSWSATPPEEERDGMVMVAAANRTSGFIGDTAGSNMLKSVAAMLPPSSPPPHHPNKHRKWPLQTLSNSSKLPIMSGHLNLQSLQNHLIDVYFTTYNISYPILHELTFREQCSSRLRLPTNSTWHCIYYMVLAIAEWVAGYADEHQSIFYEAARSRLRIDILETGTMAVVQLLMMLGNYLQKRDRPNTGYNYIGIAYRVALGLGLHRETSSSHQTTTFVQHRRRLLFWTLYSFESGFSLTTGRPTLVSDSFIDVRKPQNIDDSCATPTTPLPIEVDHPTGCTALTAHARLAVIANRVHSDFLSVPACPNVDYQIAVIEQALQNWRQSLPHAFWIDEVPEWFLAPRQLVLWREANLRIVFLLAGQRHQSDERDKMVIGTRCHEVALNAIHDIVNFCEANSALSHLGISWYAVYYLSQAVLALGVHQLKAQRESHRHTASQHGSDSAEWQNALARADTCLETLGRSNKAALRTLRILHKLRQNMQTGFDSQPSSTRETNFSDISPAQNAQTTMLNGQIRTHQQVEPAQTPLGNVANLNQPNSSGPVPFLNTSPADIIATKFVENNWVGAADPSLHMFLDNVDSIEEIFRDIQGFPSTLEQDNFAYMTSSMQTMRGDVLGDSWLDFIDPSLEGDMHGHP